jgi:hypothetical protein
MLASRDGGGSKLHFKLQTERLKRKVVDNCFEAIKKKPAGRGQNAIVCYGYGSGEGEGHSDEKPEAGA